MSVGKGSISRVNRIKEQRSGSGECSGNLVINHSTIQGLVIQSSIIELSKLIPAPADWRNCNHSRERFEKLKNSIARFGLLEPLLVRKLGDDGFQILSGSLRFKACVELGIEKVRCEVIENIDADVVRAILKDLEFSRVDEVEETVKPISIHETKFKSVSGIRQELPDYLL